jgi:predicted GNAT family N-acyltransferase
LIIENSLRILPVRVNGSGGAMKRHLDKDNMRHEEDWYGNNAAVRCPVCGKVFIVSTFINKGQRDCPICHLSSAEITSAGVTIQGLDVEEIPTVCTRAELLARNRLEEFISLVEEGGAINLDSVKAKLPKAEKVAFIEREGKFVAVAAKKQAIASYCESIALKSGYALQSITPELGYVTVSNSCRGQHLSGKVVRRVLFEFGEGPVFATTSDKKMKSVLARSGFRWVGHEWRSERTNELLSLWIRSTVV